MNSNPFVNQPEHDLQLITSELAAHNVPMPDEPAGILGRWRKLVQDDADNSNPAASQRRLDEVADAYAAGDHDRAEHLAAAAASAQMRQAARRKARLGLSQQFRTAIRDSDAVAALAAQAKPLTKHLQQCSNLDHLDVTAHIRNGDRESADLAAFAEPKASALNRLYRLKAVIVGRPLPFEDDRVRHAETEVRDRAILQSACSIWRNPHDAPNVRGTSNLPDSAEGWCSAFRAGLEPWFPTLDESDTLAASLVDSMPPEQLGFFGRGVSAQQAHDAIVERSTRQRVKFDGVA